MSSLQRAEKYSHGILSLCRQLGIDFFLWIGCSFTIMFDVSNAAGSPPPKKEKLLSFLCCRSSMYAVKFSWTDTFTDLSNVVVGKDHDVCGHVSMFAHDLYPRGNYRTQRQTNIYSRKGAASVKTWPFSVCNLLAVGVNVSHEVHNAFSTCQTWIKKAFVAFVMVRCDRASVYIMYEERTTSVGPSACPAFERKLDRKVDQSRRVTLLTRTLLSH